MADVAAFVFLAIMAFRTWFAISHERPVFREFGQPVALAAVAFLYPLAPLVLLLGMRLIGIIPSIGAAAMCFVPGLVVARRGMKAFERSGTDRTDGALKAATQAFGTALAGLIYVAAVAAILAAGYLHSGEGGA